jgi:hypothetical protein
MPRAYEMKAADGRVYRMDGDDPVHAARRVADLHQVTVIAWRHPAVDIAVGCPTTD